MKCSWCKQDLNDEESQSPRSNKFNEPLCDTCYMDEYMISCDWCEEYYDKSERGAIGSLLVAFDGCGVEPGVYEVTEHPYWYSNYFDTWLEKDAIKKLSAELPFDNCDYLIGHLCPDCCRKWREQDANNWQELPKWT